MFASPPFESSSQAQQRNVNPEIEVKFIIVEKGEQSVIKKKTLGIDDKKKKVWDSLKSN